MTIHHDKLAYGKLASMQESVSKSRIDEMLKALNAENDGAESDELHKTDTNQDKTDIKNDEK